MLERFKNFFSLEGQSLPAIDHLSSSEPPGLAKERVSIERIIAENGSLIQDMRESVGVSKELLQELNALATALQNTDMETPTFENESPPGINETVDLLKKWEQVEKKLTEAENPADDNTSVSRRHANLAQKKIEILAEQDTSGEYDNLDEFLAGLIAKLQSRLTNLGLSINGQALEAGMLGTKGFGVVEVRQALAEHIERVARQQRPLDEELARLVMIVEKLPEDLVGTDEAKKTIEAAKERAKNRGFQVWENESEEYQELHQLAQSLIGQADVVWIRKYEAFSGLGSDSLDSLRKAERGWAKKKSGHRKKCPNALVVFRAKNESGEEEIKSIDFTDEASRIDVTRDNIHQLIRARLVVRDQRFVDPKHEVTPLAEQQINAAIDNFGQATVEIDGVSTTLMHVFEIAGRLDKSQLTQILKGSPEELKNIGKLIEANRSGLVRIGDSLQKEVLDIHKKDWEQQSQLKENITTAEKKMAEALINHAESSTALRALKKDPNHKQWLKKKSKGQSPETIVREHDWKKTHGDAIEKEDSNEDYHEARKKFDEALDGWLGNQLLDAEHLIADHQDLLTMNEEGIPAFLELRLNGFLDMFEDMMEDEKKHQLKRITDNLTVQIKNSRAALSDIEAGIQARKVWSERSSILSSNDIDRVPDGIDSEKARAVRVWVDKNIAVITHDLATCQEESRQLAVKAFLKENRGELKKLAETTDADEIDRLINGPILEIVRQELIRQDKSKTEEERANSDRDAALKQEVNIILSGYDFDRDIADLTSDIPRLVGQLMSYIEDKGVDEKSAAQIFLAAQRNKLADKSYLANAMEAVTVFFLSVKGIKNIDTRNGNGENKLSNESVVKLARTHIDNIRSKMEGGQFENTPEQWLELRRSLVDQYKDQAPPEIINDLYETVRGTLEDMLQEDGQPLQPTPAGIYRYQTPESSYDLSNGDWGRFVPEVEITPDTSPVINREEVQKALGETSTNEERAALSNTGLAALREQAEDLAALSKLRKLEADPSTTEDMKDRVEEKLSALLEKYKAIGAEKGVAVNDQKDLLRFLQIEIEAKLDSHDFTTPEGESFSGRVENGVPAEAVLIILNERIEEIKDISKDIEDQKENDRVATLLEQAKDLVTLSEQQRKEKDANAQEGERKIAKEEIQKLLEKHKEDALAKGEEFNSVIDLARFLQAEIETQLDTYDIRTPEGKPFSGIVENGILAETVLKTLDKHLNECLEEMQLVERKDYQQKNQLLARKVRGQVDQEAREKLQEAMIRQQKEKFVAEKAHKEKREIIVAKWTGEAGQPVESLFELQQPIDITLDRLFAEGEECAKAEALFGQLGELGRNKFSHKLRSLSMALVQSPDLPHPITLNSGITFLDDFQDCFDEAMQDPFDIQAAEQLISYRNAVQKATPLLAKVALQTLEEIKESQNQSRKAAAKAAKSEYSKIEELTDGLKAKVEKLNKRRSGLGSFFRKKNTAELQQSVERDTESLAEKKETYWEEKFTELINEYRQELYESWKGENDSSKPALDSAIVERKLLSILPEGMMADSKNRPELMNRITNIANQLVASFKEYAQNKENEEKAISRHNQRPRRPRS